MTTAINERIKVHTVFNAVGRKIVPVKFQWGSRVYRIEEVTYTWHTQQGAATLLHFAAREGQNLFELVFSTHNMTWELRTVTLADAGDGMQEAGCRRQDAGCRMQDAGCKMQDEGVTTKALG